MKTLVQIRMRAIMGLAAAAVLGLMVSFVSAQVDPVNGEVTVTTDGGYARLVLRLDEEVESKVSMSGAILIISFQRPVSIPVEQISTRAPSYFSAARQDPDGTAIRIALARKVKIHTIPAAEKLFVDVLPDNWVGLMPGLPQEVIDDLAKRARDAEQQLRKQQLAAKAKPPPTIRVKVGVQPTFVRYIFDLPETVSAVPERSPGKFALNFDQGLKFDLADARATMPQSVARIDGEGDRDLSSVTFRLNGTPPVRTYREGRSIIVDIDVGIATAPERDAAQKPDRPKGGAAGQDAAPVIAPPKTVPSDGGATSIRGDLTTPAAPSAPAGKPPEVSAKSASAVEVPAPVAVPPASPQRQAEATPAASAPAVAAPETKPPAATPAAAAKPAAPPLPLDMLAAKQSASEPQPKADSAGPPKSSKSPKLPMSPADASAPVKVSVHRQGGALRLDFPFAAPTPAAVFRRGRVMWAVFDTAAEIEPGALNDDKLIRRITVDRGRDGEAILRLTLEEPKLATFFPEGPGWVLLIGDAVVEPTRPVSIARSIVGKGRSSITIPFSDPRKLHRVSDPDVGDTLLVVTALGPARGFLKEQDFVELRALGSAHGVVVQPLADDISAELAADKIVITRPGGLSLSSSSLSTRDNNNNANFQPLVFDTQTWGFDRQANFRERQSDLIARAAAAPESKRRAARFDLARFYLARDMAAEAKGVLDVATADERDDTATGSVLKAVADVMLNRPDEALKELASPKVGDNSDAPIWRAMAHAAQGRWAQAREEFRGVEVATGALPVELQRRAKKELLRCSIEVRDFAGASSVLNDFETLGVPPELLPSLQLLTGRLEEGLGHNAEALAAYRFAADSQDRRYAAQGRLRDILLRHKLGDLPRKDVISQLEELTTAWRGDETEAEGLQLLAHLYTQDKRYRDAFHVMRTALLAHPNSDLTRKIQDEAAATFDSLFMSGEGDAMPAIEALGLFYDYRELTPIGRRGDEMIRRLADRLVSVDLLDQAAELLQHQVDHRLQGAARAQVATRLATIYLMNHKPDKALAAIQTTRLSDLANDLRDQRTLLEARALSDIGRHALALEVIESMKGPQVLRLRADILWAAKKWRDAAEAIELMYGERWKDFAPLTDQERHDVLRGAIAYALADDAMGLRRFREKYAAKMSEGPDRQAFEVVSAPIGAASKEFRAVAAAIGNVGTLDAFLREMRKRYPDKEPDAPSASAPQTQPAQTQAQAAPAKAEAAKTEATKSPAGAPAKADNTPTGSILPPKKRGAK
jgi:hypothetical protein